MSYTTNLSFPRPSTMIWPIPFLEKSQFIFVFHSECPQHGPPTTFVVFSLLYGTYALKGRAMVLVSLGILHSLIRSQILWWLLNSATGKIKKFLFPLDSHLHKSNDFTVILLTLHLWPSSQFLNYISPNSLK